MSLATTPLPWEKILGFTVLVVFAGVLLGFMLRNCRPLRGAAFDSLEKAAQQFKGRLDPGSWFRRPRVLFDWHGFPVEISWGPRGSDEIRISAKVLAGGAVPGVLRIYRSGPWPPGGGLFGPARFFTGDSEVDREFAFRIRPVSLAGALLGAERRAQTLKLVGQLGRRDEIALARGVLRVSVAANSVSPGDIVGMGRLVRELVTLLLNASKHD